MARKFIPRDTLLELHAVPEPNSGCWIWTGTRNSYGYGQISKKKGGALAHRWSYEHFIGPIPDGLQIDHLCRTRSCVNPQHLEPVTAKVNILRGTGLAAANALKTHCAQGHQLIADNVSMLPSQRECKLCRKAWNRGYSLRGKLK